MVVLSLLYLWENCYGISSIGKSRVKSIRIVAWILGDLWQTSEYQ
ncbi:hypothetical protein QWZ13_01085 [Reinekea marina]|nr:hypothetical protein [Reinekea marina]MDN3647496.1 hypothetical protein [Reinekea marina]